MLIFREILNKITKKWLLSFNRRHIGNLDDRRVWKETSVWNGKFSIVRINFFEK